MIPRLRNRYGFNKVDPAHSPGSVLDCEQFGLAGCGVHDDKCPGNRLEVITSSVFVRVKPLLVGQFGVNTVGPTGDIGDDHGGNNHHPETDWLPFVLLAAHGYRCLASGPKSQIASAMNAQIRPDIANGPSGLGALLHAYNANPGKAAQRIPERLSDTISERIPRNPSMVRKAGCSSLALSMVARAGCRQFHNTKARPSAHHLEAPRSAYQDTQPSRAQSDACSVTTLSENSRFSRWPLSELTKYVSASLVPRGGIGQGSEKSISINVPPFIRSGGISLAAFLSISSTNSLKSNSPLS